MRNQKIFKSEKNYSLQIDESDSFLRYKLLYFFTFAALGVVMPYFPIYYQSLSLNNVYIGILCMIPNFCSFLLAPIVSFIGDILHTHDELMMISLLSSTICTIAMLFITDFNLLLMVVLIGSVMGAPLIPLIDALVFSTLPDKVRYGEMRLRGAVSYGVFSLIGGISTAVEDEGNVKTGADPRSFRLVFYLHALCSLLSGFILLCIFNKLQIRNIQQFIFQNSFPTARENKEELEELNRMNEKTMISSTELPESQEKRSVLLAFIQVFYDHPESLVFSIVMILSGFGSGVIESFLFLRLKQLGGSSYVMGISRFVKSIAEIPLFQVSGYLQGKFGIWTMLAVTQIAFVVQFTCYSFLTVPWFVLPCEVLHGFTFAAMWSISCSYANMISPPEYHSSMQALFQGLHWGFGSGMGSLIGGISYDKFGAVLLFKVSGLLSFCSFFLVIYISIFKSRRLKESLHLQGTDYSVVTEPEVNTNDNDA